MCVLTDIADCPLYIVSHDAGGLGCVDDMSQPCLVARGKMDWQAGLLALAKSGRDYPSVVHFLNTRGTA